MIMRNIIILILGLLCVVPAAHGAVEYCAKEDMLWVTDYPADWPCSPRLLARIDRTFGWGKVHLDEESDTVTVSAGLRIGKNDGSCAYFQVGSEEYPDETLIVQGEVRVYPTWLKDENSGTPLQAKSKGGVNCLSLGVRDNPSVNAALLLEKSAHGKHRLVVGGFSGNASVNAGGRLCVYNSLIAPRGDVPMETAEMGGLDRLELINATVRGFSGAFGNRLGNGLFQDSRFERCGFALTGSYQDMARGIIFSECGTAVSVTRNLALSDCVFTGNKWNWALNSKGRLVAVDCTIDSYDKGAYAERTAFFISKRHIIVRVVDKDGKPVKGAVVQVTMTTKADSEAREYDVLQAVTGKSGRTPGRGEKGALLLSERLVRAAGDKKSDPVQTQYSYRVETTIGKRAAGIINFVPRHSWEELTLTLVEPKAALAE